MKYTQKIQDLGYMFSLLFNTAFQFMAPRALPGSNILIRLYKVEPNYVSMENV